MSDAVVLAEVVERRVRHLQVVVAARANGGEERIVVTDLGALLSAAVR